MDDPAIAQPPVPSIPNRVRPGRGIMPTQAEVRERVSFVAEMLCQGLTKGQIKKASEQQWGVVARTTETYLSRARKLLAEESRGKDFEEARGAALRFYQSVQRDPKVAPKDKLRAQERIDLILGLEAPKRQEISGPGGRPVQVAPAGPDLSKLSEDELRQFISLCEKAEGKAPLAILDVPAA